MTSLKSKVYYNVHFNESYGKQPALPKIGQNGRLAVNYWRYDTGIVRHQHNDDQIFASPTQAYLLSQCRNRDILHIGSKLLILFETTIVVSYLLSHYHRCPQLQVISNMVELSAKEIIDNRESAIKRTGSPAVYLRKKL